SYFLWALVALRLCVPFSISTKFSIFGLHNLFSGSSAQTVITDPLPQTFAPDTVPDTGTQDVITQAGNSPLVSASAGITLAQVLVVIWLCGTVAMLIYGIVSYVLLKKRMSTATRLEGNVFCSENVLSPFAMGFIRPKIFIPYGLDDITREKIIAHEKYHIRRLDHLAKPFAFILLAVHWFNPLCWLAFNRMSLDMEMSCDEKLLRAQGDEEMKKIYTKALLSFASNRRFPAPGPVNFNESGNAKKRINNSLNYKKPRVWVSVLAYLFCAVMLVACATDASGTTYTDINKAVFQEAPYVVTYKSNGDGTCTVTDIIIDYSASGSVTVVIPQLSPDGDKVTEVEIEGFNTLSTLNVPVLITNESFDEIKETLKEANADERDIRRFISFYDPHEQDGIYVLEPAIIEEEYDKISDILVKIGYTSQNAYDAAVEVINTVPATGDEAVALRLQAFDYFYHSANKIKCIIVPEEAEVNGAGNVSIFYHTVDNDYVSGYISGEISFVPET
ncbi:MAG: M56 family metallopeptidase, partial [Clostridia bacterium]|nr:M56 family metallopeptidase [Clostridia bacterium]